MGQSSDPRAGVRASQYDERETHVIALRIRIIKPWPEKQLVELQDEARTVLLGLLRTWGLL